MLIRTSISIYAYYKHELYIIIYGFYSHTTYCTSTCIMMRNKNIYKCVVKVNTNT